MSGDLGNLAGDRLEQRGRAERFLKAVKPVRLRIFMTILLHFFDRVKVGANPLNPLGS